MSIRVLLADDQAMVRAGFRMILESDPEIEVVGEAANGEQATASTRRLRPDIVLMDIQMPDGDGLEATRRITEDGELHSRVVILTTFERDEYVFEALRSGASGFLLKNAPPEELLHAVHVVTAGEALLAPSVTRRIVEQFARRPVRPELGTRLDALTEREREVLRMLAHGKSNAELAAELFVTEGTIKTHVSSLLAKLGLRDRVQAVVLSGGLANQRTVGQRARHEHCLGHPSLVRRTPVIARRSSRWSSCFAQAVRGARGCTSS